MEDTKTPLQTVGDLLMPPEKLEKSLFTESTADVEAIKLYFVDIHGLHRFTSESEAFFFTLGRTEMLELFDLQVV